MATILIVDDKEDNRKFLVTLLKYDNHQLLEAWDGGQALDIAKKTHPDLIITDLVMPTIDGYELVYRLRNIPKLKNTKVIFYTAEYSDPEAIELSKMCGVSHFIVKPMDPHLILEVINTVLNQLEEIPNIEEIKALRKKHQAYLAKKMYQKIEELALSSKKNKELMEISVRDPLTNLFNRRYLEDSLIREISRAMRMNKQIAVLMIDIDFFKNINDQFGHTSGDQILRLVGKSLEKDTRKSDIVARYGGEEFVVVMPDISLKNAMLHAEKLRKEIEGLSDKLPKDIPQKVTISIGLALFPQCGHDTETLIKEADVALYAAKHKGRNQVVLSEYVGRQE